MPTNEDLIFEVVVDSVEAAQAAQRGGAHRVELCANLLEGGTTPSWGTIQLARERLHIDVNVMIRPRGGDFCYSETEFQVMHRDVQAAKQLEANGVVFGILNPDGSIDAPRTERLVRLARPLNVTFHRAFDMTADPYEALDALVELGVDRVLTSGQENSVLEGLDLITELIQRAGDQLIVMPGAGITERNIEKIVAQSHPREIHIYAPATVQSAMQYRNDRCYMGGELRPPEFSLAVTDPGRVRAFINAAGA
jgi:copper homeostasis protein